MKNKRIFRLTVLGCLAGVSLVAQTAQEYPLRPVTTENGKPLTEEIVYRATTLDDRGFNRTVEKVAQPTVTLYRAAHPAHRRAAMVICPGGGYLHVVIDREGHMIARYLQEQGITAIVLKYRLPDPAADHEAMPRPQQDALAALQYVRQHAAEWDVDPARVGILGCSAGGHLAGSAAILGQATEGSRPDFAVLLYPVVVMEGPSVHAGSRDRLLGPGATPARLAEFSLERQVRSGLPPFFIAHAQDDKGVLPDNSVQLAAALKEKNVPAQLMLVATGGHGFSLGRDEESARWKPAFLEWLDQLP